jgi:ribosome-interacting GTPase 1
MLRCSNEGPIAMYRTVIARVNEKKSAEPVLLIHRSTHVLKITKGVNADHGRAKVRRQEVQRKTRRADSQVMRQAHLLLDTDVIDIVYPRGSRRTVGWRKHS